MIKTIWMFFIIVICISCASHQSYGKENWAYSFFISTPETKEGVLKKWGKPSEKGFHKLGNENTEFLRYRNSENRHYADFFINPETGKVVEKAYSPDNVSEEFHLKKLKETYFSNITFEKIPVKCRHHKELI